MGVAFAVLEAFALVARVLAVAETPTDTLALTETAALVVPATEEVALELLTEVMLELLTELAWIAALTVVDALRVLVEIMAVVDEVDEETVAPVLFCQSALVFTGVIFLVIFIVIY